MRIIPIVFCPVPFRFTLGARRCPIIVVTVCGGGHKYHYTVFHANVAATLPGPYQNGHNGKCMTSNTAVGLPHVRINCSSAPDVADPPSKSTPTAEAVLNPFIGYEPARYTRSRLFDSVPTVSLTLSILLL